MFCLLSYPPFWGKFLCSGMPSFGQLSLYESDLIVVFLWGFFGERCILLNFIEKRLDGRKYLKWHGEIFAEILCMCVSGVVHLSQINLEELLTIPTFFCGKEPELDYSESQEQVCSLLDHSK